jgi:23S rRNA pseudouridine2605 synthase
MNSANETKEYKGERIAKVMARAGLCSRREAERWIAAGRVTVNGQKLKDAAVNVVGEDKVLVDGEPLREPEAARLWRYHKPPGLLTTNKDPKGRPTVFEKLPRHLPRVISVGRLDFTSEGLLLLTNDGALARRLELPATGWLRRYRVRAHGTVSQESLDRLANGVEIEGVRYGGIDVAIERQQGANMWLLAALREGKNREVRRVLEHLGLTVNRLIRVSYGPFQLGDLPRGDVEEVPRRVLRDQLGGEDTKRGHATAGAKKNARRRRKT